jgi:signal peptidase II
MGNTRPVFQRFEIWVALALVVLDQVTKALVVRGLALHENVTLVPGLLDLTHVRNTGAAFGMFNAVDFRYKAAVITVLALAALAAIVTFAGRLASESMLARVGFTLVVAGAIGNLIDRARQGYVVDFVDVYWRGWHFWAFNVADSAITVGAAAIILDLLLSGRRHASQAV